MTAGAVLLASLLFLVVAVASRERRHSRLCQSMNVSLTRQIKAANHAVAEQTWQARQARAAVAALQAQNGRLLRRLDVAEAVAAQRQAELDGLRDEHVQALRESGS